VNPSRVRLRGGAFVLGLLAAGAFAPGCSCGRARDVSAANAASPPPADSEQGPSRTDSGVVVDFVKSLDQCAFGHRGVLLDFGDPAMTADLRAGGGHGPAHDEVVEHEGATWLRVHSRVLSASFYWPTAAASDASDASVYVEARTLGVSARAIAVLIDGKTVGSWSITRAETRTVATHGATPVTLAPGGHELTLHVIGGSRSGDEALAEIDWVHIGTGDPGEPYAAPTRANVVADATLGGRSIRSLSLRAPGFVRCSGWIPANATLEASLATAGGGDADVEARLVRDRRQPVVLGAASVAGGSSVWVPWSVPVTGLDGEGALASIELVVKRATKGTRLLLGDPRVVAAGASAAAPAPPRVRGVVVVILGSTPARVLSPWGGPHAVPELSALAASGTTFLANRASSPLASSVVASILTGLSPLESGLDDPDARLPDEVTTVEQACREGNVATAMFTANPTTGAAFGFARGWDTFTMHDPLEDAPATRVFEDAAAWIDAHKADRFLVVVHARGGHPPWDATPDELKTMPPDGYFGMIEPRRAAEAMAKARKHPGRFKEDDRVRAWALFDRAIDEHDAALGRLLAAIRTAGRDDDTAVVVTSDVAASEGPPVPFADPETLEEPLLATPLVVRWPGATSLAARRVTAPSGPADLARTVLDALGLAPPAAFEGQDLAAIASGTGLPEQRPLLAAHRGRYSVRWGPYVLLGTPAREVRMCDLSLDPSCVADVRGTSPLALEPLRHWTLEVLSPAARRAARSPAVLDEHTMAALARWGRASDERENDEPF
jgi:arylsulfatase A-like enzyme